MLTDIQNWLNNIPDGWITEKLEENENMADGWITEKLEENENMTEGWITEKDEQNENINQMPKEHESSGLTEDPGIVVQDLEYNFSGMDASEILGFIFIYIFFLYLILICFLS